MRDDDFEVSINLTPLLDVVFVVLILFMVIVPILQLDQVTLAPGGAAQTHTALERSEVALHVRADDKIFFHQQEIAPENLDKLLLSLHAKYPEASVQLFQDKNARFGTYQLVKNHCTLAGFKEMEVLLEPTAS
ncbi:MAG: biopolymer transporter ExbD [Verrucomicrobia bacterium]|nr:biopolymer transporter ExbD [Verrucomicrobiota bacterium]